MNGLIMDISLRLMNIVKQIKNKKEEMEMNNFEIKKKIVLSGGSKIFQNWHSHAGISMDDFINGLEWLCGDPLNEKERMTRELGCVVCNGKGELVKLIRVYYKNGDFAGFYREDTKTLWEGHVSISVRDKI